MKKITTIIRKEWAEVFKNRMVISTILFMPLLFAAIPLVMFYVTRGTGGGDLSSDMPPQFLEMCAKDLTAMECFQSFMSNQFMLLFMIIPLMVPVNIAAYSIVGEKTTRSLEPLLATPITTTELLAGKNLSAVIPAVGATWLGFLIYLVGVLIIVDSPRVLAALVNPMWLLAVIFLGPLLAVLSVNFSILVSSRVNDPRVAEQVSAVVILPILAVFFGQITGLFLVNRSLVLIITLVVLAVDVGMLYITVRLFQRETILTRWK
jgi:ABC-2 type transport system permease protein